MSMHGVRQKSERAHHAWSAAVPTNPLDNWCHACWVYVYVQRSEASESGVGVLDVSLLRGGHGEGDPLCRRLLPLLRDRLDLGEKLHASLA